MKKTKIFAITGSTRGNSSNYRILKFISEQISDLFEVEIFEELDQLPHLIRIWITKILPKKLQLLEMK